MGHLPDRGEGVEGKVYPIRGRSGRNDPRHRHLVLEGQLADETGVLVLLGRAAAGGEAGLVPGGPGAGGDEHRPDRAEPPTGALRRVLDVLAGEFDVEVGEELL